VGITIGLEDAAKIKSWNLFSSKMVSLKQDSDLVLNRACSNFTSNSRSSMLVTPSLGKDRYRSGRNTGVTGFSFLLCTSFSGSDTGIAASGSGLLLV
jgi:hypothetical protein